MIISINAGSEPIQGATETEAVRNIAQFCRDCADQAIHNEIAGHYPGEPVYRATPLPAWWRKPDLDRNGRYGFRVSVAGEMHTVEMPGLPLDQVRYLKRPGQSIWDFPRLYVDESSWVWCFGLLKVEPNEP